MSQPPQRERGSLGASPKEGQKGEGQQQHEATAPREAAGAAVSGSPALWLKQKAVQPETSDTVEPRPPPSTPPSGPLVSPRKGPLADGADDADECGVFNLGLEALQQDLLDPKKRRGLIEEAFAAQGMTVVEREDYSSSSTHESLQRNTNELASSLFTGPSAVPPSLPASCHSANPDGHVGGFGFDSDADDSGREAGRQGPPILPAPPRRNVGTGRFARVGSFSDDDDDF
eukprot:Hpha_TRINITY_DN15913_c5_g5::TRINITY_DN15913_c5_g5_i1::g.74177::m.74177